MSAIERGLRLFPGSVASVIRRRPIFRRRNRNVRRIPLQAPAPHVFPHGDVPHKFINRMSVRERASGSLCRSYSLKNFLYRRTVPRTAFVGSLKLIQDSFDLSHDPHHLVLASSTMESVPFASANGIRNLFHFRIALSHPLTRMVLTSSERASFAKM